MKFRSWFGSSLVLVLMLAATVSLFYYWDQMKVESVRMLQDRLNQMELQRFEEEKGNLVVLSGRQSAERFNAIVSQARDRVEKIADQANFRRPHTQDADRRTKKQNFKQVTMQQKGWHAALITDETGQVLSWSGKEKPPTTIGPTPAFEEASKQRVTALRILPKDKQLSVLQITTPCLTGRGAFLGVIQAEIPLSLNTLRKLVAKNGFSVFITNEEGRLLTPAPRETFPAMLGELLNQDAKAVKAMLSKPANGFFKASWEKNLFLMAQMPTVIPGTYAVTVLEVPGLDRVVGTNYANESMFRDPVVLGGLGLIVLVGLFLMLLFSGSSAAGAKRINRQLKEMMEPGAELTPVDSPGKGEWEKLTDHLNDLIDRVKTLAGQGVPAAPVVTAGGADPEELARTTQALQAAREELDDLRKQVDQVMVQNQDYSQQIEALQQHNQELEAAKAGESDGPPPVPETGALDEIMAKIKADGALRIEAIASMSEDLKATLMVIKNYISSILSSEEGKITDAQQEFLGVVINKSARLERQINDLLDISHMESGVTQLYPSKTDLVSMLQDVVLNSQPQADTKQIRIIQEIQSPLPQIMIDSDRLGQVFINLVQHAMKITGVGGEIQITALETLSDLVVKIRDGGTTLSEEQSNRVFSIFHGSDSEAGADISGSGLRFPIIKRIVDAHQGRIEVRGLPGQGNETIVTFPKTEGFVVDEAPSESPAMAAESQPEETYSREDSDDSLPYDLTSFMGKMDEFETQPEPAPERSEPVSDNLQEPSLPGADDDLNKLLSDIENIEENT